MTDGPRRGMVAALWLLRIALYAQLLLGVLRLLTMFGAFALDRRIWELHLGLGVVIALMALVRLGPRPDLPKPGLRAAARFVPLLALALGLLPRMGLAFGLPLALLHAAVGLAAVALVEMAAARERRAAR